MLQQFSSLTCLLRGLEVFKIFSVGTNVNNIKYDYVRFSGNFHIMFDVTRIVSRLSFEPRNDFKS